MVDDQVMVPVAREKATVSALAGETTRLRTVHVSGDSLETCQRRVPLKKSWVSQEPGNETVFLGVVVGGGAMTRGYDGEEDTLVRQIVVTSGLRREALRSV